jgi:hypothetical protein
MFCVLTSKHFQILSRVNPYRSGTRFHVEALNEVYIKTQETLKKGDIPVGELLRTV